jgi:predicted PurR-regulated permease PerM
MNFYKEIDFCGMYLPPFFPGLLIAALIAFALHRLFDRIVLQRWVANRPVFEMAMFVIVLGVLTFILC